MWQCDLLSDNKLDSINAQLFYRGRMSDSTSLNSFNFRTSANSLNSSNSHTLTPALFVTPIPPHSSWISPHCPTYSLYRRRRRKGEGRSACSIGATQFNMRFGTTPFDFVQEQWQQSQGVPYPEIVYYCWDGIMAPSPSAVHISSRTPSFLGHNYSSWLCFQPLRLRALTFVV